MRVVVIGAGLMGSQIGFEYALGGHEVVLVGRRPDAVRERLESALVLVRELGRTAEIEAAAGRIEVRDRAEVPCELAVESLPEDAELKAALLRPVAEASPHAVLASNTSSLSISELGEAIEAPERMVGTHYWNPPLLMPLVEVVAGARTAPRVVAFVRETLAALGKRAVLVERDVPGFVWNRLQAALLRECVWLVEQGAASAETVDEVIRSGLARRYRHIGLFQAIALGGVETWSRVMANLFPTLSSADRISDLARLVPSAPDLEAVRERRDRALIAELRRERSHDD